MHILVNVAMILYLYLMGMGRGILLLIVSDVTVLVSDFIDSKAKHLHWDP